MIVFEALFSYFMQFLLVSFILQKMDLSRKKPYRFNETSDVKLLREVLAQNPFQDQKKWSSIADALRGDSDIQIDGRRARERTSLLTLKLKLTYRFDLNQF